MVALVLAYFDPNKELSIQCDASGYSWGMLVRALTYDIKVQYLKCQDMLPTDTLS